MKRARSRTPARWTAAVALAGAGAMLAAGMPAGEVIDGAPEVSSAAVATSGGTPSAVAPPRAASPSPDLAGSRAAIEAPAEPAPPPVLATEVGSASYYASSLAGRRTASGIPYDPTAAVAAHRTLPFGTRLRVHNLSNGESMEVTVVDRGPFARGRILDLSRSAAERLDFVREGHVRVRIEVLEYGDGRYRG